MKKNLIPSLILLTILFKLTLGQNIFAAENCSNYLDLLEEYQKDHQELLACGISADDYFMKVNRDEQAAWCEKSTQAEVDQRSGQAGLPTLHCAGMLHYFSFESDRKRSQHWGLIDALYETVTLKPVSPEILKAIIAHPGKRTGTKLSVFPIQDLQDSSPTCRLSGVKTNLSTNPTRIHWLVSAELPCQRDEFNQSPFWLVEQQSDQYRVLLAYRSDVIYAQTKRHQGYSLLKTHHTLDNGHNDDANITWQYDATQGQYRYLASRCSNISRMDDTEPASFEDCYKDETWQ